MIPTPSTCHVDFGRVYEPAEDSYLMLDTLSSDTERAFLKTRFDTRLDGNSHSPLIVEVGSGSGVVISFIHAHANTILGRSDVLTLGFDVNPFACKSTVETVGLAEEEYNSSHGFYLGNILADLTSPVRSEQIDILLVNPPYVPTEELPKLPVVDDITKTSYEIVSQLLSLSYSGGVDGVETTNRLLDSLREVLCHRRGCAYVLLCAQNKPEQMKTRVKSWGANWLVETVRGSGKQGGWEQLQIIRIWHT